VKTLEKHHEIVSLVGTLSCVDGHHLHTSLSDKEGRVIGGHVFGEMRVFTTAEIAIAECLDLTFSRPIDPETGFDELSIKNTNL
jgi:predicted DNA-binding protein with PD1-like motif